MSLQDCCECFSVLEADFVHGRFTLTTPEGEKLVNQNGVPTIIRINVKFEKMDHQANLT